MENVEANVVGKITPHILNSIIFRKSCPECGNVEEFYKAGQTTGGNMGHAHCMLDN
jgi:predicted nucleic-acid-binding Zn-ribbon protein